MSAIHAFAGFVHASHNGTPSPRSADAAIPESVPLPSLSGTRPTIFAEPIGDRPRTSDEGLPEPEPSGRRLRETDGPGEHGTQGDPAAKAFSAWLETLAADRPITGRAGA